MLFVRGTLLVSFISVHTTLMLRNPFYCQCTFYSFLKSLPFILLPRTLRRAKVAGVAAVAVAAANWFLVSTIFVVF
jgi:hypothetical protein